MIWYIIALGSLLLLLPEILLILRESSSLLRGGVRRMTSSFSGVLLRISLRIDPSPVKEYLRTEKVLLREGVIR